MYIFLALLFFATVVVGILLALCLALRFHAPRSWRKITAIYFLWIIAYGVFIVFGTGTDVPRIYSPARSPYKLPWVAGVSRLVSQGNRSFTSHRGAILFAWDFWMPQGTEILAARSGKVINVKEDFNGFGLYSNYVLIEHDDRTKAMYAHIQKSGAIVDVGDWIEQGQRIAYSGMVGQTVNPHLHFVVFNSDQTESLPIAFSDVAEDGVPQAGRFYTSGNARPSNAVMD